MSRRMNVPATFDGIASSHVFIALGTPDYLRELRDHGDAYLQVEMARALRKPAILMMSVHLTPQEQEELRHYLDVLEIAGTFHIDEKAKGNLGVNAKDQDELIKIFERYNPRRWGKG
jgi:hypothetical protein